MTRPSALAQIRDRADRAASLLEDLSRRYFRPPSASATLQAGGGVLSFDAGPSVALDQPGAGAALAALVQAKLADIRIEAAAAFAAQFEAPEAARPHLAGVVASKAGALTPYPAASLLFGFAERQEQAGGPLTVDVLLVPKAIAERATKALAAAGAASVHLSVLRESGQPVPLQSHAQGETRLRGHLRRGLLAACAAAAAATVLAVILPPLLTLWHDNARADLEARIRSAAAVLKYGPNPFQPKTPAERDAVAAKLSQPSPVKALNDLAGALPDTAYASSVTIEGRRVQASGRAQDAPAAITALEASGQFTGSTLTGPVRAAEDGRGAEFALEATSSGAAWRRAP